MILEKVTECVQWLENAYGQTVQIDEAITQQPGNYNRHFTSFGRFVFGLKYAGVRISGARWMIHGEGMGYEISTGNIITIEALTPGGWEITERLAETVERKSIIRLVEVAP